MSLHDPELLVCQGFGLVEDVQRRPHLADVMHERGHAELPQQLSLDPERPRLRHDENQTFTMCVNV
jgi:hypothetical protein